MFQDGLFGFLGASADDEAEGEADGVVVFARDLALEAKTDMVYELDAYPRLDSKACMSKAVTAEYCDAGGKTEKRIYFSTLTKVVV